MVSYYKIIKHAFIDCVLKHYHGKITNFNSNYVFYEIIVPF